MHVHCWTEAVITRDALTFAFELGMRLLLENKNDITGLAIRNLVGFLREIDFVLRKWDQKCE